MSKILTCIWVTSGRHKETEKLILTATKSRVAHAAVEIDHPVRGRVVFEAVRPCLRFSPPDIFDGATYIEKSDIELTDEQFDAVIKRMDELEGKPYGIDDCITGGAHDLATRFISEEAGEHVARVLDHIIDNEDSYNCSQTQVEIIKTAFDNYGEKKDTSKWTPEESRLYKYWFFQNN